MLGLNQICGSFVSPTSVKYWYGISWLSNKIIGSESSTCPGFSVQFQMFDVKQTKKLNKIFLLMYNSTILWTVPEQKITDNCTDSLGCKIPSNGALFPFVMALSLLFPFLLLSLAKIGWPVGPNRRKPLSSASATLSIDHLTLRSLWLTRRVIYCKDKIIEVISVKKPFCNKIHSFSLGLCSKVQVLCLSVAHLAFSRAWRDVNKVGPQNKLKARVSNADWLTQRSRDNLSSRCHDCHVNRPWVNYVGHHVYPCCWGRRGCGCRARCGRLPLVYRYWNDKIVRRHLATKKH